MPKKRRLEEASEDEIQQETQYSRESAQHQNEENERRHEEEEKNIIIEYTSGFLSIQVEHTQNEKKFRWEKERSHYVTAISGNRKEEEVLTLNATRELVYNTTDDVASLKWATEEIYEKETGTSIKLRTYRRKKNVVFIRLKNASTYFPETFKF
ncbi:hypothetical protein AVEN_180316-1 [Araneus ventricosus]|uniref:Uncharacterized protein n=1 Tax=Araneus ventricosus TaxID=182803 RepID=A0A4Y2LLY1_ARAVE|nr:hypothetical protein AVEN_180316-1 [Araneus ventricosus]